MSRALPTLIGVVLSTMMIAIYPTPARAASITISLPHQVSGFMSVQFPDIAGVVMAGQTLGIDFAFLGSPVRMLNRSSIWSELFFYTAPHNPPNPNGDFPYNQYVVFGSASTAYLLDSTGNILQTPMWNWHGGTIAAPGPVLGTVLTPSGFAGADMIAFTPNGAEVSGIHFDLVLPDTGETLQSGQIGVNLQQVPEGDLSTIVGFVVLLTMAKGIAKRRTIHLSHSLGRLND